MVEWNEHAIIFSTQKYGENNKLLTVFSKQHGLYKGLLKYANSKKQRGIYQTGNLVDLTWKARLSEQLGTFTGELIESIPALFLHDNTRLSALTSACALTETILPERDPHPLTYDLLTNLLYQLKVNNPAWLTHYLMFELETLTTLGFQLDLSECAATGTTENLYYISPKTGRAVSKQAGEPYKEKLLLLPQTLNTINPLDPDTYQNHTLPAKETAKILALTSFFLHKYLTYYCEKPLPDSRKRLVQQLQKTLKHEPEAA